MFSHWIMSNSLQPHGLQHTRLPCPSASPGVYSNTCPLSQWCHPTISSSVTASSCLQSFPVSGSFPVSQLFASGGQSIGASASVLPVKIEGWFPLGLTSLISLLSKGLSRVFYSTTVQEVKLHYHKVSEWEHSHEKIISGFIRSFAGDADDLCWVIKECTLVVTMSSGAWLL